MRPELLSCNTPRLIMGGAILLLWSAVGYGQSGSYIQTSQPSLSAPDSVRKLEAEVQELRAALVRMQGQMDRLQAETTRLNAEVRQSRSRERDSASASLASLVPSSHPATPSSPSLQEPTAGDSVGQGQSESKLSQLEEDQELLSAKVNDQYQTKVESASKYRVRLSGIALFNAFTNRGSVDNQDVPTWAIPRGPLTTNGAFGATVRQSELGLEAFGPELAGAKTSGEVQLDFFGVVPPTSNGVTEGQVRMRTATVRLDWTNTSVIAGQDTLFFAPLSPTSYASLAEPALSYAGNLWSWTPQVRIEHRIPVSDNSGIILQAGILDPLTGEVPRFAFDRVPQAGESSGQPALATRVAWTQSAFGRPLTVGVGGYWSQENWGFSRHITGWAGTADVDLPLGHWFTFTGEFYRGRAIGGLGGGLGRSVLYNGPLTSPSTEVVGMATVGGWGQLAFKPWERIEFNGAWGEDNPLAGNFAYFNAPQSYISSTLTRNRGAFTNVIYHPRSNLVLSLEYRRLWSYYIDEGSQKANQINLAVGVLF